MDFPLGSETINQYIKEYLSYNEFKNTYDCFVAELQAKTVSIKLISQKPKENKPDAPRIYELLKGDKEKTLKENTLEEGLWNINNAYKKTLNAGRNVLSASIGFIEFLDANKEKFKGLQDFDEKIESYKLNLSRFHSILLIDKPKPIEELSFDALKKLKKSFYEEFHKQPPTIKSLIEILLDIRINILSTSQESSLKTLKNLISIDFFEISDSDDPYKIIFEIFALKDHALKTCIISMISMICGINEGIIYITRDFHRNELIKHIIDIAKEQKKNTVIYRFSLAILQKISIFKEIFKIFLTFELTNWLIFSLSSIDSDDFSNDFTIAYTIGLFLNVMIYLTKENIETLNIKEAFPGGLEIVINLVLKLLTLEKITFFSKYNILLCLSCFFEEKFLKELETTNFIKKIKDFFNNTKKSQSIPESHKNALESLLYKLFPLEDQNLGLHLSQNQEFRKITFFKELERKKHSESRNFEVFSDETY